MPPARTRAPLPRITDPYWPWEEPENDSEIMAVEKVRVAHNSESVDSKKYTVKKAASSNSAKAEAAQRKYEVEELRYERIYGKFVPDAANAAWFRRKAPRVDELLVARAAAVDATSHDEPCMQRYLTLATEFETDFGHQFSAKDGTDHHFDRMAFHAAQANGLKVIYGDDDVKIAEIITKPVVFDIHNPYPECHPRRGDFDSKLRKLSALCRSIDNAPAPLPTANGVVPFCIVNELAQSSCLAEQRHGYYDALYVKEQIYKLYGHHWEEINDYVGEKRENPYTPFVLRAPLW
ncbi:hypothetical protein C8R43DRAFT_1131037 [Mycena crocata]|nr:hypothetical protein C8R43DRAFT_1131037 [Mycena crocata]